MYFYYHKESKNIWCQEEPLDPEELINKPQEITQEEFFKIGDKLGLLQDVSQSKIKTFRRCHRAYHYKYVLKLRRRIKAKALFMGIIVHECIELWLKGKPWKGPINKAKKEISKMFSEEALDFQDIVPMTTDMVEGYIKNYKDDGLTPLEVELEIRIPLMGNMCFVGKVDSLQEEIENGRKWQVEHKTCASIPEEKNRMSDIQTILYDWALPIAGYEKPIGVIWDYLRKKLPAVPLLLKSGELSKNKSIDTTQEVYRKAVKDNGLNIEDYEEFIETLAGREDNFHRRIKMPISQNAVDSVVEDLKSTAIQIKEIGHLVKDRNMTRDCSWCEYYIICQSELRGGDTENLLKREFTTKEQRDAQEKRKKKSKK